MKNLKTVFHNAMLCLIFSLTFVGLISFTSGNSFSDPIDDESNGCGTGQRVCAVSTSQPHR